jgi:hypothetical protein
MLQACSIILGLQGNNRVPFPEAFDQWTPSGGASVNPNAAAPPYGTLANFGYGNNISLPADEITLPSGGRISLQLGNFQRSGALQGQIWIYPLAAGTITLSSTVPPGVTLSTQTVNFASLTLNQWNRVYIDQLTTDGAAAPAAAGTFAITGTTAAHFYAWGADLTQIDQSGAAPLPIDPGPTMYSTFIEGTGAEFLELPPITQSTASTGFCLSVRAQPPAGMAWTSPAFTGRGLISWYHGSSGALAELMYAGPDLVFHVSNGVTSGDLFVTTPPSWTAGSPHTLKACVDPSGVAEVYGEDVLLGSSATLPAPVNLSGGAVQVGSSGLGHWQGYVKSAAVCRKPGAIADCH